MLGNTQIQILSAVDTGSQTGSAVWVGQCFSASFVPIFGDSSAAGTVKIQASNDIPNEAPSKFTPIHWADIPNATSTIASGAGPAILIPQMSFAYIRAVYTSGSGGSSTVTVNMNMTTG